jgi:cytochrome c6
MKLSVGIKIVAAAALLALLAMMPAARADDAKTTYGKKCVACHAADGTGSTPAGQKLGAHDLASADVQKESEADMAEIIAKGKNKMPAYAKSLSADDIKGLVAYIRTFAKK